jgi:hypothetical protein
MKRKQAPVRAEKGDPKAAFISALTTEHFVLQTAANATVTDAAARSSLYLFSLSSSLVAMGFVSRSPEIFVPFMAIILPGLFVLGLFTIVRLVDDFLENMRCLVGIARIRGRYRRLTAEAAEYFAARHGRWPEGISEPALWSGPLVAFATTSASMIAFINSFVAGIGISLLANYLFPAQADFLSVLLGVFVAVLLMAGSLAYQRARTNTFLADLEVSP